MAKLLYLSVFSLAEQAGISMVSQNCATDGRYLAPRLCAYPTPDEASAINQGLREGIDLYVSDRSVDADTRACRKDWVASQQLKVTATTNLGDIVQATSLPILQGDLTRHGTVAKLLFTNNYFPDYAVCWDQPAMQRARREAMRPVETFSTAATQKRVING